MKYIIIGLGVFGSALAEKLTNQGHEVIGVDKSFNKVETIKDKITNAICMDSADMSAVKNLPLKNADVVIICIGDNEGANIMATALMKKMSVKRLIGRALSPLHKNILEAMGVEEILCPEEEAADRWMRKLTNHSIIDSFELTDGYGIVEVQVPNRYIGKNLQEIGLKRNYGIIVLSIMKKKIIKNIFGNQTKELITKGIPDAETILVEGDILVLYGKNDNIKKIMKE